MPYITASQNQCLVNYLLDLIASKYYTNKFTDKQFSIKDDEMFMVFMIEIMSVICIYQRTNLKLTDNNNRIS